MANVDRMRAHVAAYTEWCRSRGQASTATGLIAHLRSLARNEQDAQASIADATAVNVSTWHSSKGLEWPITILYDLHKKYDGNPMGVHVVSNFDAFDVNNPLANRELRYWPYPYGKKSSNVPFLDKLATTPEKTAADLWEDQQERRVLYVAWTRARDRVVLAGPPDELDTSKMLALVSDKNGRLISEPKDDQETVWAGCKIDLAKREPAPLTNAAAAATPSSAIVPTGPGVFAPATASPSGIEVVGHVGRVEPLGGHLQFSGDPVMTALGDAVHGFFAADRQTLSDAERESIIAALLSGWGVAGALLPAEVVAASDRLYHFVEREWSGAKWYREWTLTDRTNEGTAISGTADLVLGTDEGWIVIDHKSFPGTKEEATTRVAKYGGQLAAYADALAHATELPVLSTWIHLPIVGLMVEVQPSG
jgi:ATP-dependent exoDNAse (exonuclease V) beta subunit